MVYVHIPVLLKEVIEYIRPQPGQNFVDATLGGGGYTRALLEHSQPGGKVLSIDLDEEAITNIKSEIRSSKSEKKSEILNSESVIPHHGNFRDIDKAVDAKNFKNIAGIVADLGFSSYQLDDAGRGLSFQKKESLNMRLNNSGESIDAKFIVNSYDAKQLTKIFRDYGEEKFALQIAKKITEYRVHTKEIHYTTQLYEIIESALPKPFRHKAADSARRVFQALRIAVNHELENLEAFMPKAFGLLAPKGRLAIVTFHSLEDRMVKQYFQGLARGCVCPPDFPQCVCGKEPEGKIITKKPICASPEELAKNPRSKPAKLRVIQKVSPLV